MKASLHIGKGSANHNDRNFDIENAEHIDETIDNIYINFVDNNKTFQASELDYYIKHYTKALDEQNERFKKLRQYKRMKSIEDIYKSKKTEPQEIILQIGNYDEQITGDELEMILVEFLQDTQSKYNDNFHVLNVALHNDEATPHVHIRAVFDYKKNDTKHIGINGAMKEMGVQLPKPDEPEGRYNNRKITFTDTLRKSWIKTIEEYGHAIDKVVKNPSQKHLNTLQYKTKKLTEQSEQLEQDNKVINQKNQKIKEDNQKMELAYFETADNIDLLKAEEKKAIQNIKDIKEYKGELLEQTEEQFTKLNNVKNYYNRLAQCYERGSIDDVLNASKFKDIVENVKTFINKNDR